MLGRRTVLIRVLGQGEIAGSILLSRGRLAWATAREHQVDLAAQLCRDDVIAEKDVGETRRRFNGPGRLAELAQSLMDGGLSSTRFRHVLLRHLRAVLTTLLSSGGRPAVTDATVGFDETLTFGWEEFFFDEMGEPILRPTRLPSATQD